MATAPRHGARQAAWIAPMLAVALATACSPADGAGAATPAGDDGAMESEPGRLPPEDVPTLRATLVLEELIGGRNAAQENYREAVRICEAAGTPIKPLLPEQVARLGTGVIELLADGRRRLARETTWRWTPQAGPESLCLFEFEEHLREHYMDARSVGWSGDDDTPGWQEEALAPGDFGGLPVDVEEESRLAAGVGWQSLGVGNAAGQPCASWRNDRVQACIWSGGAAAGFSPAPLGLGEHCFTAPVDRFFDALPLQVDAASGDGCKVRVRSISVGGGALSESDVMPKTKGTS